MNPNQINNGQVQNQQGNQTQVLNLDDVQNAAKQEKKASFPKKIAICLFVLGILAIVGGVSYNPVSSMLGISPKESGTATEEEKEETEDTSKEATVEETVDKHQCQAAFPNQPNGTDKEVTYELSFNENNQLQSYVKNLKMVPTTGNSTGPVTINKYKNGYTTIAGYQIPGYTLAVTPTNNGEIAGLQVTLNIDLTSFDKTKYSTYDMMGDDVAQVDLELNATKEAVAQVLNAKGYQCK